MAAAKPPTPKKRLILHLRVPGIWCDDLPESAALWADPEGTVPTPEDYLNVVLEEWLRQDVGLTVVTLPCEKDDETQVHAYTAQIIGVEVEDNPDYETDRESDQ